MLIWAAAFLVLALTVGFLGFGGVASVSAGFAQALFVVFLLLLLTSISMHALRDRRSVLTRETGGFDEQ